jgi:hypothetical protein
MSKPIAYRCQGRRAGKPCSNRARYHGTEGPRCGHCRNHRDIKPENFVQPTVTGTTEAAAASGYALVRRSGAPVNARRGAGDMPGRGRLSLRRRLDALEAEVVALRAEVVG